MNPRDLNSHVLARGYRRLLELYPRTYREGFGGPMEQLFRDQLRDAQRRGRRAVVRLAARTALDLARTCPLEHWRAGVGPAGVAAWTQPGRLALTMGVIAASVVLTAVVVVTRMLPETYMSSTRVHVGLRATDPFVTQTEVAFIGSEAVLGPAVEALGLTRLWAEDRVPAAILSRPEAIEFLKRKLQVRQCRETSMFEIRVYDRDRLQAANIANGVAEEYRRLRNQPDGEANRSVMITDLAEPGLKPIAPNRPLNYFVGTVAAGGTGGLLAGVGWIDGRRLQARRKPQPPD